MLQYTRSGESIYICMVHAFMGTNSTIVSYRATEAVLVFISSGWDGTNHIPSGTIENMYIPLFYKAGGTWSGTPVTPVQNAQWWIYSEGDMWTILSQASVATGNNDSIALLTFERENAKEYDDAGSYIFMYADAYQVEWDYVSSGQRCAFGSYPAAWSLPSGWNVLRTAAVMHRYVHPFVSSWPSSYAVQSNTNFADGNDFGNTGLVIPIRARKSVGNSKVYMGFPVCHSDPGTFKNPIKTLKAFFPVESGQGVADGDLINIPVTWNGGTPTTWQYIYKQVSSPDGGTLDVAVKYGTV